MFGKWAEFCKLSMRKRHTSVFYPDSRFASPFSYTKRQLADEAATHYNTNRVIGAAVSEPCGGNEKVPQED